MSLFRADRADRADDPYLVWKVRLFAVGATLGLAGIFLEQRILVWGAIGVLTIGLILRFAAGRPKDEEEA